MSQQSENTLDADFSDLIHEADKWAAELHSYEARSEAKLDTDRTQRCSPITNGTSLSIEGMTPRDKCLEQITRAISAHVTDILMQRLGLEEKVSDPTSPASINATVPSSTTHTPRKSRKPCTPSAFRSHDSLRSTPLTSRRNSVERQTLVQSARFHSENRLDRSMPPRRPHETPLENRASRLRKMSVERRAREDNSRSAVRTRRNTLNSENGL